MDMFRHALLFKLFSSVRFVYPNVVSVVSSFIMRPIIVSLVRMQQMVKTFGVSPLCWFAPSGLPQVKLGVSLSQLSTIVTFKFMSAPFPCRAPPFRYVL